MVATWQPVQNKSFRANAATQRLKEPTTTYPFIYRYILRLATSSIAIAITRMRYLLIRRKERTQSSAVTSRLRRRTAGDRTSSSTSARSRIGRGKNKKSTRTPSPTASSILAIAIVLAVIIPIAIFRTASSEDGNITNSLRISRSDGTVTRRKARTSPLPPPDQANQILGSIAEQFQIRYGKDYAAKLIQDGIESLGSVDITAQRMVDASLAGRPFVMAFSGYSVTVGRGNYFNQSFPFVLSSILKPAMEELLGIPLVVRNAAIGGVPSFPYGFCLQPFLGNDPDVIGWDYSMNDGKNDSSSLEAFVRQSFQQFSDHPMLIVLDPKPKQVQVLREYAKNHWIQDGLAVSRKKVVVETIAFAQQPLPIGFQEWDEFGSPPSCPGRCKWHPKKQEHALIGWLMAIHFTQALKIAHKKLSSGQHHIIVPNNNKNGTKDNPDGHSVVSTKEIHYPYKAYSTNIPENDQVVTELLFGHENYERIISADGTGIETTTYQMKDLSCRTSFLPVTDPSIALESVVISGLVNIDDGDGHLRDIMNERTAADYRSGWVFDISTFERKTKQKVTQCGGLGYVDVKVALYGIPESGTLRLWLPFEGPSHGHHNRDYHQQRGNKNDGEDDDSWLLASHWFDGLILCETNEKRTDKACKLDRDIDIVIGGGTTKNGTSTKIIPGIKVDAEMIHPIKGFGEYLGRPTCVHVPIPSKAKITTIDQVTKVPTDYKGQEQVQQQQTNPIFLTSQERKLLTSTSTTNKKKKNSEDQSSNSSSPPPPSIGLLLDITVRSNVHRNSGACCLSHIVWEQH